MNFKIWLGYNKKMTHEHHVYELGRVIDGNITDDMVLLKGSGILCSDKSEIFEGDILQAESGRFIVEYTRGAFIRKTIYITLKDGTKVSAVLDPVYTLYDTGGIESCTVIGNIYENPELLEHGVE